MEKGYIQLDGVDYNEILSYLVNHLSIRVLMDIVNQYNIYLEQMDFKTYFLNIYLEDTIYMEQLDGFVNDKPKVSILMKYLYGLKQSHGKWYRQFDEYLLKSNFVRNGHDNCVYIY